jgi:transposase
MTNKRNQYTREFKLEAISLVTDHNRTIPDVASSLGIGKSTLQKWLSQYRQEISGQAPKVGNALTDEQRELQELRKQVKRLTMERDILNEEG